MGMKHQLMKRSTTPFVILALLLVQNSDAYRPVALIHGVTSSYTEFPELTGWLEKDFPGIKVFPLDAFNNYNSLPSLVRQVEWFSHKLQKITDEYGEVTLLGYSQGGLIARGVLQWSDNRHIHTLISCSAPAMGQYGNPDFPPFNYLPVPDKDVWKLCYEHGQGFEAISVCDFWKDPNQFQYYLNASEILPYLNNEILTHSSARYKANFENVNQMVLLGGPNDGVILPWQSSQYAFFDQSFKIVPMEDQPVYKGNLFGLKTLKERGSLYNCVRNGVEHHYWIRNYTVYEECIKPYIG